MKINLGTKLLLSAVAVLSSCKTMNYNDGAESEFLSAPSITKPAVVFSVGSKVVESGMPLPFKQYKVINKIQSNIRVSGEADIGGEFEFVTAPSEGNSIMLNVVVNVSLDADTKASPRKGIGKDVVVRSKGVVHGQVIKTIIVNPSGIETKPAYFKDIKGSLVLKSIGAGGVLAGLKRKAARKEFYKKRRNELEKIKNEFKEEIKKEIDSKIDAAVSSINKDYVPIIKDSADDAGITSATLGLSSDARGLKMALIANESISKNITDHKMMASAKERVFVQANDLFLEKFLNEVLSAKTLKASEFIEKLDKLPIEGFTIGANETKVRVEDQNILLDPSKIVIKFPNNPVKVTLDDNILLLKVAGAISFEGGMSFDERTYEVKYKIHPRRGAPYLERLGVEVKLANEGSSDAKQEGGFSLKGLGFSAFNKLNKGISDTTTIEIKKIMEELFEVKVDLPRNIELFRTDLENSKNSKSSGYLQPRDIRAKDGWIDIVYGYSKIRNDVHYSDNADEGNETEKNEQKHNSDVCIITSPTREYCHPRVSPENCQKWAEAAGNFKARFVSGGRCFKEYPEKNIPDGTERGTCFLESSRSSKQYCKSNYSYSNCLDWGQMSSQWSSRFTIFEDCSKEYPEVNN